MGCSFRAPLSSARPEFMLRVLTHAGPKSCVSAITRYMTITAPPAACAHTPQGWRNLVVRRWRHVWCPCVSSFTVYVPENRKRVLCEKLPRVLQGTANKARCFVLRFYEHSHHDYFAPAPQGADAGAGCRMRDAGCGMQDGCTQPRRVARGARIGNKRVSTFCSLKGRLRSLIQQAALSSCLR
jgi:hypothetical protein